MREIVFLVTAEQPGRIEATAPDRGLAVEAPTLEELHHEARDALIRQVGPSHATYRIRIRRPDHNPELASGDPPAQRHSFRKARPLPTGKAAGDGLGIAGPTPAAPTEPMGLNVNAPRFHLTSAGAMPWEGSSQLPARERPDSGCR